MKKILISPVLFLTVIAGCEKDDNSSPEEIGTKITIDASDISKWIYFSFQDDSIVDIDNPSSSLEWDLAFQKYNIKTNGGKSGSGIAEAFESENLHFNELKEAPENGYEKDLDSISSTIVGYTHEEPIMPIYNFDTGNPVLKSWQSFDLTLQPPPIIINNHVFAIKTAKGMYAKIKFKDYYKKDDLGNYVYAENSMSDEKIKISGYIEFIYSYQPDGSNILE